MSDYNIKWNCNSAFDKLDYNILLFFIFMLKISSVYFVDNFYLLLELYTRNIELDMKNHKKKRQRMILKLIESTLER